MKNCRRLVKMTCGVAGTLAVLAATAGALGQVPSTAWIAEGQPMSARLMKSTIDALRAYLESDLGLGGTYAVVDIRPKGAGPVTAIQIQAQESDEARIVFADNDADETPRWAIGYRDTLGVEANGDFVISAGGTLQSDVKMTIASTGNVGIGRSAAQDLLHLSSGAANTAVRVDQSASGVSTRVLSATAHGYVGTTSNHSMLLGAANGDHVTITPTGQVGIGTQTPDSRLHVIGNTHVGDLIVEGTITNSALTQLMGRLLAGAAAIAMCRASEGNNTSDAVRLDQNETGTQRCMSARNAQCRETHVIYLNDPTGADLEEALIACADPADYSNPRNLGAFACCER